MVKYTDVFTMIHKKISSNNSVIAIYELKIKQNNIMTELQEKLRKHNQDKITIYKEINEIELLQSTEYTVEREKIVTDLYTSAIIDKFEEELCKSYYDELNNIKELVKYHLDIIEYLNEKIPKNRNCG